jgi:hypothetical protein
VSEEQLALALRHAPMALSLVLETRGGATLDVLLVDESRPGALLSHLRLQPSVVLLAPPRGDLLAMPVMARSELASSLRRLPPRGLLGLGDGSLTRSLAQFAELASLPFTCRRGWGGWIRRGSICDGSCGRRSRPAERGTGRTHCSACQASGSFRSRCRFKSRAPWNTPRT